MSTAVPTRRPVRRRMPQFRFPRLSITHLRNKAKYIEYHDRGVRAGVNEVRRTPRQEVAQFSESCIIVLSPSRI
jgi:hypothetical protein